MNKEEPYRDQAERLKQRIQKINEKNEIMEESGRLPPREEIHRQRKKKTKWKLKYPIIRLLVLCFILLPIIIFSVISYRNGVVIKNGTEKTSSSTGGYEKVNIGKPKKDDKPTPDHSRDAEGTSDEEKQVTSKGEKSEEPKVEREQPDAGNQPNSSVPSPVAVAGNPQNQDTDKSSQPKIEPVKNPANSTANSSKTIYHTVQPQETLFKLAKKYYHSANGIEIIKKSNNLRSDEIKVGQVLKIPLNN